MSTRGSYSRREFLKSTALGAAAASAMGAPALTPILRGYASAAPLAAGSTPARASVVRVVCERVLSGKVVQAAFLRDCLAEGLTALTGRRRVADAWHAVLKPDDVVLLKLNQAGAGTIGTSAPMAEELTRSLVSAGWDPQRIIILEAPPETAALRRTRPPDLRWQGTEVEFGASGKDVFLAALAEATAIINVPFLKTHHLATMTSCMKNLSHGLIRHPASFHANGCDPAIGEIVASEAIRGKLRLNIINCLRVVYDRGPDAHDGDIHPAVSLLFGTDVVACDAVGYALLNEARSIHGMGPILTGARLPQQIITAARLGLGQPDAQYIDVQRIAM